MGGLHLAMHATKSTATSINSCVRSVRMREQLGNRSYRQIPRQLCGYVRRLQVQKISGLGLILERFTNTRLNFTRVNTFTFTHDLSYICNHLLDVNFSETQKTLPNYRRLEAHARKARRIKTKRETIGRLKK